MECYHLNQIQYNLISDCKTAIFFLPVWYSVSRAVDVRKLATEVLEVIVKKYFLCSHEYYGSSLLKNCLKMLYIRLLYNNYIILFTKLININILNNNNSNNNSSWTSAVPSNCLVKGEYKSWKLTSQIY